jgi:hypothetical protein
MTREPREGLWWCRMVNFPKRRSEEHGLAPPQSRSPLHSLSEFSYTDRRTTTNGCTPLTEGLGWGKGAQDTRNVLKIDPFTLEPPPFRPRFDI